MSNSEIDLCTVSYQTLPLLRRQIDTLYNDPVEKNWKYFVADNGSTDGSTEYLGEVFRNTFRIDFLAVQSNVGYAKACNQLAALGTSPIIGLLNADVWFTAYDIQNVIQFFTDHPEAAIMGPKQRDENQLIRHGGIFGTNNRHVNCKHRGWNEYDPEDRLYKDIVECTTVSGSAYFIRRDVWNELTNCPLYKLGGGFDSNEVFWGAFLPTPHYY